MFPPLLLTSPRQKKRQVGNISRTEGVGKEVKDWILNCSSCSSCRSPEPCAKLPSFSFSQCFTRAPVLKRRWISSSALRAETPGFETGVSCSGCELNGENCSSRVQRSVFAPWPLERTGCSGRYTASSLAVGIEIRMLFIIHSVTDGRHCMRERCCRKWSTLIWLWRMLKNCIC